MNAPGQGIGLLVLSATAAAAVATGCGASAKGGPSAPRCVLDAHPELGEMPACPGGTELKTRCERSRVELWCATADGTRHGVCPRFLVDDEGDVDRREGEFRKGSPARRLDVGCAQQYAGIKSAMRIRGWRRWGGGAVGAVVVGVSPASACGRSKPSRAKDSATARSRNAWE